MNDYDSLASLYDRLQDRGPAEALAAYAAELATTCGATPEGRGDGRDGRRLLLDLGCGTGSFSRDMAARGFDVIGIDASEGMLRQAMDATPPDSRDILYLQQDITRFELFGTVDAICCLTDTVNHITSSPALQRMFRLCRRYLNREGVLVFDVATRIHFARRLGRRTRYEVDDESVLFWRNAFSRATNRNTADLVLFTNNGDGTWTRGDETIVERFYDNRTLTAMLRTAGFQGIRVFDARRRTPAGPSAQRVFFVATLSENP